MLRRMVYQDSIIAKARHLVQTMRDEGDLTTAAATAIFDVLDSIGIPNGGIALVLGDDITFIDDRPLDPTKCSICQDPATLIATLKDGSHALVCEKHANQARLAELVVC